MASERWTEEETKLALFLYFQLPFGKLHRGTPEIQQLANAIGRTHSSVAMKLSNLASFDPSIISSGRKGLDGASKLDRQVFERFVNDWEGLLSETDKLWETIVADGDSAQVKEDRSTFNFEYYSDHDSTERLVDQRVGQSFFRRAVLANYDDRCCITGISDRRFLNASHIKPWADDLENRHNPANGIALSPTFDRAFDRGLMTIEADGRVLMSQQLISHDHTATREYFQKYHTRVIHFPTKFPLNAEFLDWHKRNLFAN